jgi:hypothetical protein
VLAKGFVALVSPALPNTTASALVAGASRSSLTDTIN